ncbi:putative rnase3 domain-containing protein [Erysiphe necator]|uniref:Putative rnase3 domain-containing protein n=1 Tax=Uncinula necator TaxID=52586 RepID=A0A0B1PF52_UNCNE|nr:putative rnase3 domain-containing protein [Erysiphe necator]
MDNKRKHNSDELAERSYKQRKKDALLLRPQGTSTSTSDTENNRTQNSVFFKTVEKCQAALYVQNLVRDLDEILDQDIRGSISEILSDETLKKCLSLQTSLRESKEKIFQKIGKDKSSENFHHENSKLPKILSPLSISPWKSSSIPSEYPPLPEILDPTLEAATFIHCSVSAGRKGALNYEQLELIGDAYMELIATLLISQTFPSLSPGKQSQIRELLIKNITLAKYSLQYQFEKRLKIDWTLLQSTSLTKVKVLGDVFEAFVAAVILSDPIDGVQRASQWLKSLWSMTIATTIKLEDKSENKVQSHLWHLRGNISPEKVAEAFNNQPIELNAKEKLQKLIGGKHAKLSYRDLSPPTKDPQTKLAVFSIGVFLDGWGEKNKMLGSGQANGKKEAGLKAAAVALNNEKLIKLYADQKKALMGLETKDNQSST